MALIDAAAVIASGGYIYVAPTATAKPATITDPLSPGEGWESVGHTSLDELPEFGRDGDEPSTLGSWQNKKLRVINPDVTYTVTFNSVQANETTYQLYFGAGAGATQGDGSFRIPASPTAQEKAILVIIVDGENYLPLWHPRVSLLGSDAVSLATDQFVTFPITGTFLADSSIGGAIGEWFSIAA